MKLPSDLARFIRDQLIQPRTTLSIGDIGATEFHESHNSTNSQDWSMRLETHRHNPKPSTFIPSEQYFNVPVTELR